MIVEESKSPDHQYGEISKRPPKDIIGVLRMIFEGCADLLEIVVLQFGMPEDEGAEDGFTEGHFHYDKGTFGDYGLKQFLDKHISGDDKQAFLLLDKMEADGSGSCNESRNTCDHFHGEAGTGKFFIKVIGRRIKTSIAFGSEGDSLSFTGQGENFLAHTVVSQEGFIALS